MKPTIFLLATIILLANVSFGQNRFNNLIPSSGYSFSLSPGYSAPSHNGTYNYGSNNYNFGNPYNYTPNYGSTYLKNQSYQHQSNTLTIPYIPNYNQAYQHSRQPNMIYNNYRYRNLYDYLFDSFPY
jgi:hypothetical protein